MRCKKNDSGQTLLVSVLVLVILLLASVFLFDLQSIIRGKVKSQAAVDAAALSGAEWQKNTLNMIGELNLIKATTVLMDDYVERKDYGNFLDDPEEIQLLKEKSDMISNMQARISFVGPMIGFGAAQQAAKNNGIDANDEFSEVVLDHRNRVESEDGMYISEEVPPMIPASNRNNGFEWREGYKELIDSVLYQNGDTTGVAVAPNTRFMGVPYVVGDNWFDSYANLESIYDAINGNDWCVLKSILDGEKSFDGKWWGDLEAPNTSNFIEEAEYLPVGVKFVRGTRMEHVFEDNKDIMENYSKQWADDSTLISDVTFATDDNGNEISPFPYIQFCRYDNSWRGYSERYTSVWETFFNKPFLPGMNYLGCSTRMKAKVQTKLHFKGMDDEEGDVTLGEGLRFSDSRYGESGESFEEIGKSVSRIERRQLREDVEIEVSATAKPIGRLEGDAVYIPNYVGMVLPVFETTALIPVAMEDQGGLDPFNVDFYRWVTEGLIIMGESATIGQAEASLRSHEHWSSFSSYFSAIEKLDDPVWRQEGIDWLTCETGGDPIYDEDGNVTGYTEVKERSEYCDWHHGNASYYAGPSKLH